jgi:DNA-binding protein HU-beta
LLYWSAPRAGNPHQIRQLSKKPLGNTPSEVNDKFLLDCTLFIDANVKQLNVQEDQMSLNKSELVAAIAAETGESQAAVNRVVDSFFDVIAKTIVKGGKVTIPGWLSVEKGHRAARQGRNPQTGETIQIKASNTVKVSAGSKLKAAVK